MKIKNVNIKFCHIPKNSMRVRCSIIASGGILFFLGIQGICNIFNHNLLVPHQELFSYLFLLIGFVMILISLISCHGNNDYENLSDSNN